MLKPSVIRVRTGPSLSILKPHSHEIFDVLVDVRTNPLPSTVLVGTGVVANSGAVSPAVLSGLKTFKIATDADGIAVVTIDVAGSKVNTIDQTLAKEMAVVLDEVVCQ